MSYMVCPNCGTQNEDVNNFCLKCGGSLQLSNQKLNSKETTTKNIGINMSIPEGSDKQQIELLETQMKNKTIGELRDIIASTEYTELAREISRRELYERGVSVKLVTESFRSAERGGSIPWTLKVGSEYRLYEGLASNQQIFFERLGRALVGKGYEERKELDKNIRYYSTTWTKGAIKIYLDNEDIRVYYVFKPAVVTCIIALIGILFYLIGFFIVIAIWYGVSMLSMRKEMIFESDYVADMLNKSVQKAFPIVGAKENKLDQITKLKKFKDDGIITQDEFEAKKKQLLEQI